MRVFNFVVMSFLATMMLGAGLLLALPGDFSERAIWLAIFVPVFWAGFMFYCYWDAKTWRVTLNLFGICVAGTLAVLFIPIPA